MRNALLFTFLATGLVPAALRAQVVVLNETTRFVAHDGAADAQYGTGIALDGRTMAVGSWMSGPGYQRGSVYVYGWNGSSWIFRQRLTPNDPATQYRFGEKLSLQGDRLAIGCSWDGVGSYQSGAVYVFERSAGVWTQCVKLKGSNVVADRMLGRSVALDGDTIVAGAPFERWPYTLPGNVHVFRLVAGSWSEEAVLSATGPSISAALGRSVALQGDRLVAGAPGSTYSPGPSASSVRVYTRVGSSWTQTAVLAPGGADQLFGQGVALDGNRIVAGAPGALTYDGDGRAYVYDLVSNVWTLTQTLRGHDTETNARFGESVALSGTDLVVGATSIPATPSGGLGAVYTFALQAGVWNPQFKLRQSSPGQRDNFGLELALDGARVLVAAPEDDDLGVDSGAAFLFPIQAVLLGTASCLGDGSAGPCPCGNTTPTTAMSGCSNSTGGGSRTYAVGSLSIASDDLVVHVLGVPNTTVQLSASNATQPAITFGNGLLCLASPIMVRTRTATSQAVSFGPGLSATAPWIAGQTWSFQALHRDAPSTCTARRNSSNVVQIAFVP